MKKIIFLFVICLVSACTNKNQSPASTSDSTDCVQTSKAQEPLKMGNKSFSDSFLLGSKQYIYQIAVTPDETLPKVREEETGDVWCDNRISIKILRDSTAVFQKDFTKTDFASHLDDNFKVNSILEGIMFRQASNGEAVFSASVCYPQSDLFIPFALKIQLSNGNVTISKEEMDELEETEE